MRKADIKTELDQMRYDRDILSVKIYDRMKSGKPFEDLQKTLADLKSKIANYGKEPKPVSVPKPKKKVVKIEWPDLTYKQAEKELTQWLEDNDYEDKYQFRHSENFFMIKPVIYQDKKQKMIGLKFELRYETKSRRVVKDIDWEVPYGQWSRIGNRLESLEKVILKETSDPDRFDQVFGYNRFQNKLFFEKGYDKNGWKIKK